jgi:hypothetical protein
METTTFRLVAIKEECLSHADAPPNTTAKHHCDDHIPACGCRSVGDLGVSMRSFLEKRQSILIVAGTIACVVLLVLGLFRNEFVSFATLARNKDALAATASIVTTLAVSLALLGSYFRFFRGRTFSCRAELAIETKVIGTPRGDFLHVVTITLKNIGSMSIWDPKPMVTVRPRSDTMQNPYQVQWDEVEYDDGVSRKSVVDSAETATYCIWHRFAPEVWLVTYDVFVRSEDGNVWAKSASIANMADTK